MTHKDIFKTMKKNGFRRQVKRKRRTKGSLDLQGKVADAGGEGGFGLEVDSSDEENQAPNNNNKSDQNDGVYGSRKSAAASVNTMRRTRLFDKKPPSSRAGAASTKGKSSQASMASSKNPYGRLKRSSGLSSSRAGSSVRSRVVNPRLPTAAVHIVCAIGENLARETCIASLDAGTPVSLQVTKQGNGQTYAETLAYLEILRPDEVLLNEGRRNSQLARKVLQLYGGDRGPLRQDDRSQKEDASADGPCESSTVVKFIPRSCFDQTKGAELLRRVARAETYDASVVEEYILLSSAHAVLHYTQQSLGATFSRNCLDLTINSGGNNRMAIDRSTLLQLELLTNAKTGKTRNSLIATIDCTKTTVGSRLLRTNLMAPPCRIDTINARLDLVDTFLADEEFFYTVHEQLQNLPDVDKMLTNVAIVPRKARSKQTGAGEAPVITERMASKGISALVCIKSTLTALPSFAMALYDQLSQIESEEGNDANAADAVSAVTDRSSLLIGLGGGPPSTKAPQRHHLLRAIIHAMRQPGLLEIVQAVSEIFTESTSFSRNANAMRHQECFALKSPDGMMDILRKAFLANVDDIYKKADEYAETHGIHVSVRYSSSRGYYLSVPGETASTLPQEFIQPAKSGNCIHCTTEEVQSLNTRAQDNVQDLLLMTYEKIKEVLDVARSKYDTLASLSDAVALLDLCHSFADNVTLSKLPWCRPVVSGEAGESLRSQDSDSDDDSGKIAIHNGRYGIDLTDAGLASADGPGEVIPNDTYATSAKNFTVISGINGSGKSTYLKQVAIIVLLAHCGSYVPAEQASIPIRTRLCARIGTADDQENNISSFMLEMKETAFICNNASTKSLILLDELGRATSNEDGVAIAWAVSEYLLSKKSMTFFVTHYPQLCRLSNVYPSVQNQHLQAAVSRDENGGISYTHKVSPGPCNVASDYGVEMASSCGWPVDVLHNARQIELEVQEKLPENGFCDVLSTQQRDSSTLQTQRDLKSIAGRLTKLIQSETSLESLRAKLQNQRNVMSVASGGNVSANIKDLLKGSSGFEEQPGTETGHAYSCQVGPRAIDTNTRDDRLNVTSNVARRMHDIDDVVDDVMHHEAHRSVTRASKNDADDDTEDDDDDSSLSSHSSHQSS